MEEVKGSEDCYIISFTPATNTYYKLREMIVNEKLIVEDLRHDNGLKQIGLAEY